MVLCSGPSMWRAGQCSSGGRLCLTSWKSEASAMTRSAATGPTSYAFLSPPWSYALQFPPISTFSSMSSSRVCFHGQACCTSRLCSTFLLARPQCRHAASLADRACAACISDTCLAGRARYSLLASMRLVRGAAAAAPASSLPHAVLSLAVVSVCTATMLVGCGRCAGGLHGSHQGHPHPEEGPGFRA